MNHGAIERIFKDSPSSFPTGVPEGGGDMAIRLTEEQQRKLFQHIREKWGTPRSCPMCGKHKWSVDGTVYRLAALTTDPTAAHSVVQPLATVRCTHCSFIALIHLTQSGIAGPDELSLGVPKEPVGKPQNAIDPIQIGSTVHVDANDETH